MTVYPEAGRRVGIDAKWASEIEKFPIKVSQMWFPYIKQLDDITKINGDDVELTTYLGYAIGKNEKENNK